jgi:hypothetical protein
LLLSKSQNHFYLFLNTFFNLFHNAFLHTLPSLWISGIQYLSSQFRNTNLWQLWPKGVEPQCRLQFLALPFLHGAVHICNMSMLEPCLCASFQPNTYADRICNALQCSSAMFLHSPHRL